MTRARSISLAAVAALAAACGGSDPVVSRSNFRLPSAVAAFTGRTVGATSGLTTYLAVANEGRDDLSLVDAGTDRVLDAPILLRPLAVTFPGRPSQLVAASLGDALPDLLVGVAAGSSVLQLVRTWVQPYTVDADVTSPTGQAIDLGGDILGVVALPRGAAGTARLAVALSGNRLAVVGYARAAGGEHILKGAVTVHALGFEPAALAAIPDGMAVGTDLDTVYAATRDPIGPSGVLGVARIDAVSGAVTALDARGPTRLVAAARLKERAATGASALLRDEHAFDGQPDVPRVYAVLDEAGCGHGRRIACGVVTLDPDKVPAAGDDHIPEDWAGEMPYRAPIPTRGRALTLTVSGPPAVPPTGATHPAGFLRIALAADSFAITTAAAAVALESRAIDFLDLGRFKGVSTANVLTGADATAVSVPVSRTEGNRLWVQDASGTFAADEPAAMALVGVTPGYARSETWSLAYQGALPDLQLRFAEAWWDAATSRPVMALQIGDGVPGTAGRTLTRVARLYHPALGVQVGDVVVIRADTFEVAGVQQCTGEPPAGASTATTREFEAEIVELRAPSAEAPGGAVILGGPRVRGAEELSPGTPAGWTECWTALTTALAGGTPLKDLLVTVAGKGLVLTGGAVGYAGRPQLVAGQPELGVEYVLRYQEEDVLAVQCPLADWDGLFDPASPPPTCLDAACRQACESLVLARKARRHHHLGEGCSGGTAEEQAACEARFPNLATTPPTGPALSFRVGYQFTSATATRGLVRGTHRLTIVTDDGTLPFAVSPGGATTQASGAIAFDRSPLVPDSGYRFLVWYPGNQVADVSPSIAGGSLTLIR